jgi:hypothetical protein
MIHHSEVSRMKSLFGLGMATLVCLLPAAANAGVRFTYRRTTADPPMKGTWTMTFEGPRFRFDGEMNGRQSVVIIDLAEKKLVTFNPKGKTYREVRADTVARSAAEKARSKQALVDRMKGMTPDERKQAEAMVKARFGSDTPTPPPARIYQALGKAKNVAGKACKLYRVNVDRDELFEGCYSQWGAGGVATRADLEMFRSFNADMMKTFAGWSGLTEQQWSKGPGLPVEEKQYSPGHRGVVWSSVLTSYTRLAVPDSTFAVPAGLVDEAEENLRAQMEAAHGGIGMGRRHDDGVPPMLRRLPATN